MLKKLTNKKGFTLMEMLIVVAIIAVLVAIAIPTFNNALEKSREATDAANIRSAYAEVMACAMTNATEADAAKNDVDVNDDTDGEYTYSKTVKATQKQTKWQNTSIEEIAGIKVADATSDANPAVTANTLGGWTITYSEKDGSVKIVENAK